MSDRLKLKKILLLLYLYIKGNNSFKRCFTMADFHKEGYEKGYYDGSNGNKKRAVGAFDFGKLFAFVISDSNQQLYFRGYNSGYDKGLRDRENELGMEQQRSR